MRRHPTVLLTTLAAASALALSACGSSGSDATSNAAASSSGASTSTSAAASGAQATDRASSGKVLRISLSEFKITPKSGRIKAGSRTLRIVNAGKVEHALTILKAGPHGKDIQSGDLAPGSTKTIAVHLKKGRYTWFCPVGNHRMLGMTGTLVVG